MSEEEEQPETRELIEEIVNENQREEPIEEPLETAQEEEQPKAKSKAKAKPKAKVKIIKEPVEPVIEPVEPVVEVKPQQVDKLKEAGKCPDCNVSMSQHILKYIHKQRGYCKAIVGEATALPFVQPEPKLTAQPPPVLQKQPTSNNMTDDIVNQYIKENPEVVSNYLRNERLMKTQKRQMNAMSL